MKKTHEQFLEDLWNKNKHYREGKFEVIGEYIKTNAKILVKNRCGVCAITPFHLLQGANPNIVAAINKTEYFINMCVERFGSDNDDLSQVVYIDTKTKIKVSDEFGVYYITPSDYLSGRRGRVKRAEKLSTKFRSNKDDITNKIKSLHPNLEILPFDFINQLQKIPVKDKYGVCNVSIINLLGGHVPSIKTAVNQTEYFINQAKGVHGDKYDYSLVEYKGSKKKVKIVGPNGTFLQEPIRHILGQGCMVEGRKKISNCNRNNPNGWTYTNWESAAGRSKNFTGYKVYFIECWDVESDERFYKIGKTYVDIKSRFYGKSSMPYLYDILKVIETTSAKEACELEQEYKNKHSEFKYIPTKGFGGMYECFSQLNIIKCF